jgi:hypothetical protein
MNIHPVASATAASAIAFAAIGLTGSATSTSHIMSKIPGVKNSKLQSQAPESGFTGKRGIFLEPPAIGAADIGHEL